MKKVIFENGLKAFLVTFCLLVLGAVAASAQGKLTSVPVVPGVSFPPTPSSSLYDVPQGIFVNTLQAHLLLDAEMFLMKEAMLQLTQGDPAFNATLVKYRYYRAIKDHLDAGATTPNAIAAGLWIFLESLEFNNVTPAMQAALKQDAVDLLS